MHDHLSRRDIARSLRDDATCALLAVSPHALEEHAAFLRRSLEQPDHASAVALDTIAPWERALAMVAVSADVLSRVHEGRFPPRAIPTFTRGAYVEPEEAPPPKPVELIVPHADIAGYAYDPSWENGGIGAFKPDHNTDRMLGVREKVVQGIAAFRSVEHPDCGGIADLAWFYCGADFEMGITSSLEGFVSTCLHGGPQEGSTGTSPSGPGDLSRLAAAEHRRILGELSRLRHRHERALRIAYTDTRCPRQLVAAYGVGVALHVWRAQQEAGETDPRGFYQEPGAGTLARLVELVRADWPTYEGSVDGESEPLEDRIGRAAELVLWTAHEQYRIAAAPAPGPRPKPKRRRRRERPDLVQKGAVGRAKRKLVELYEVEANDGDEPRAA